MALLQVDNIRKEFEGHLALDNVSMSVRQQFIHGLLGPNGAGKTSLIRIINHIIASDKGSLQFNGHPMTRADVAKIGYLPEERGLYKKMKVEETAIYFAQLHGLKKKDAITRLKFWFERFGIENWNNRKVEELSKGMAQKLQFITTILHQPQLLIFDEPFSGFDPVNADLVKREMLYLRDQGATIILSTHNMSSVEELCDDITLINNSKVILQGSVSEVRSQFKQQVFRIIVEGAVNEAQIPHLLSTSRLDDGNTLLRVHSEDSNALLQQLLKQHKVLFFEEEIPSMNDIFINMVKGTVSHE